MAGIEHGEAQLGQATQGLHQSLTGEALRLAGCVGEEKHAFAVFVEVLNLLGRENVRAGSPGVNSRTFEVFELFQTMIPRVPSAGLLIEF